MNVIFGVSLVNQAQKNGFFHWGTFIKKEYAKYKMCDTHNGMMLTPHPPPQKKNVQTESSFSKSRKIID